jgi:putative ABC transport system ATP-binding protein
VILEAKEVYRFFDVDGRQVPVLKSISFALEAGSFTTIMGQSGSGKSTLLHILAGLDVPSAGEVTIAGMSIARLSEAERTKVRRKQIGFVFQFFNLLPDLTVRENVVLPLLIAKMPPERFKERIDGLLETLGIAALRDRLPRRLSGGEMQRVSIARALVTEPPLLLADEPTGNLSSRAGEEITALLRDVSRRFSTTVLLVTHNPRDAAAGDRVLFLNDGSLDTKSALDGGNLRAADVFRRLEELGI